MSNVYDFRPQPKPAWGGFFPSDSIERPKEREWIVKDIIPWDEVVLLTGAPGAAKSRLLLQLQICAALGDRQWIGRDVQQAKCLGLYLAEDDRDEQTRRCWEMCDGYDTDVSMLRDQLELNPRQISDAWLSTTLIDGAMQWTAFGRQLWQIVGEDFYKLIVIDTATKALGWLARKDGTWVDRLVSIFRQKCVEHHCTVIFTDHPTKSDRKGFSGVNALLGAVRSVMNIYVPNDKLHQPIRHKRVLHEIRSSYSSWEPIRLKWDNGILMADDSVDAEEPSDDTVTVRGETGIETEKGIQFYDGSKTLWLPKKLVKYEPVDRIMTMPLWLARKHGFVG